MKARDKEIFVKEIAKRGKYAQIKLTIDKITDLLYAICKMWRGEDSREEIAERIADVEIMLDQLKIMLGIEVYIEINRDEKINRL